MRLFSNIMTVGAWTLLSRILGMGREVLFYTMIGVGPVLDAFIVAFRLPNMFRRFFAEGAFNAAFVPLFSKQVENDQSPNEFASQSIGWLSAILIVFTTLAIIFMPGLVWVTAGGFSNDTRFDLAVQYGRIIFPYIFLISLAALLSGVLNSKGHFSMAAAAPVVLNILIILAIGIAWLSDQSTITFLVWSIPLAGVLQLSLLWNAVRKSGVNITIARPRLSPEMGHLLKIAFPAALANGVVQINLLVGQIVASFSPGAVSWLYGADRLYQLPLGVVGTAVSIVLLPELSKRLQANDDIGAKTAFCRAGEISFALTFPAAVALFFVPFPMVSALFEHGATHRSDAEAMAFACAIYGLGLPAFILQKLLQPLYFAREDTRTPFIYAILAMLVNGVLAVGLMPHFGWISAAIAMSVSSWVMVILLKYGARKFGATAQFGTQTKTRFLRIAIASLVMGTILWIGDLYLGPMMQTSVMRVFYGAGIVFAGIALYLFFVQLNGGLSLGELRSSTRRP